MVLSMGIVACGVFLAFLGSRAVREKRMKFMPLNRGKTLNGEPAVKAGRGLIFLGFFIGFVGLVLAIV